MLKKFKIKIEHRGAQILIHGGTSGRKRGQGSIPQGVGNPWDRLPPPSSSHALSAEIASYDQVHHDPLGCGTEISFPRAVAEPI
jgi:hypothetical protein